MQMRGSAQAADVRQNGTATTGTALSASELKRALRLAGQTACADLSGKHREDYEQFLAAAMSDQGFTYDGVVWTRVA